MTPSSLSMLTDGFQDSELMPGSFVSVSCSMSLCCSTHAAEDATTTCEPYTSTTSPDRRSPSLPQPSCQAALCMNAQCDAHAVV